MRLADGTALARAQQQADAGQARRSRAASGTGAAGPGRPGDNAQDTVPGEGDAVFAAAAAALQAGRDAVIEVRDDLEFEDWPAPKRLAPYALAFEATAYRDGVEAGTGRIVLLHDPAGQDGWAGTFRVVAQVTADVEEEMAADPLLGEVGWSWLTDALDLHAPGYQAPSGTVTRVITEGFGVKSEDPQVTAFELRASWSPAEDEIAGSVLAWCDLLVAATGLPAQPPGTRALGTRGGPGGRRRR